MWGQTTKHKLDDNSKFKISIHTKDVGNKDCLLFTSASNDEDKVHTDEDENCLLDKDEKGEHLNSLILVVPLEELGWDLKNEKFKDNAPQTSQK